MANIRLVVVDDHTLIREALRIVFERDPVIEVVGEAATVTEAVALVDSLAPDAAILDLPGWSGIEATTGMKCSCPSLAVLFWACRDDYAHISAALSAGAAGYLLKNASATEIVRAIPRVVAGEPVLDPAVVRMLLERVSAPNDPLGDSSNPALRPHDLTHQELTVLHLAATGLNNVAIASELRCSVRTVQVHLGHVFHKLGVCSRTAAVTTALRMGIVALGPSPRLL